MSSVCHREGGKEGRWVWFTFSHVFCFFSFLEGRRTAHSTAQDERETERSPKERICSLQKPTHQTDGGVHTRPREVHSPVCNSGAPVAAAAAVVWKLLGGGAGDDEDVVLQQRVVAGTAGNRRVGRRDKQERQKNEERR